jgi:hypothetical protein
MRVFGMVLAGLLVLTAPMAAHAIPQGPKTEPAETCPADGTVQVRDAYNTNWRPAPGSPGNSWRAPQWGPSRYYGGWVPYGGPGVPTYWVWGSQGGAWDYPFADWRGPDGGWGNP